MRTYALAARRFWLSTAFAAGARPRVASPGLDAREMDGADLVYICVHGLHGQPYWYDDTFATVLSAEQLRQARIPGAIVYLAGCYGIGPMSEALLEAGAAAVVADRDINFSGFWLPLGSNALGRLFVKELKAGHAVGAALNDAKWGYRYAHSSPRDLALLDTVELVGDAGAQLVRA